MFTELPPNTVRIAHNGIVIRTMWPKSLVRLYTVMNIGQEFLDIQYAYLFDIPAVLLPGGGGGSGTFPVGRGQSPIL